MVGTPPLPYPFHFHGSKKKSRALSSPSRRLGAFSASFGKNGSCSVSMAGHSSRVPLVARTGEFPIAWTKENFRPDDEESEDDFSEDWRGLPKTGETGEGRKI